MPLLECPSKMFVFWALPLILLPFCSIYHNWCEWKIKQLIHPCHGKYKPFSWVSQSILLFVWAPLLWLLERILFLVVLQFFSFFCIVNAFQNLMSQGLIISFNLTFTKPIMHYFSIQSSKTDSPIDRDILDDVGSLFSFFKSWKCVF